MNRCNLSLHSLCCASSSCRCAHWYMIALTYYGKQRYGALILMTSLFNIKQIRQELDWKNDRHDRSRVFLGAGEGVRYACPGRADWGSLINVQRSQGSHQLSDCLDWELEQWGSIIVYTSSTIALDYRQEEVLRARLQVPIMGRVISLMGPLAAQLIDLISQRQLL